MLSFQKKNPVDNLSSYWTVLHCWRTFSTRSLMSDYKAEIQTLHIDFDLPLLTLYTRQKQCIDEK